MKSFMQENNIVKAKYVAAGAGAFVLLAGFAAGALAQPSYPTRPIRILVGFAPGGAADITARVIGEKFTLSMGANVSPLTTARTRLRITSLQRPYREW